MLSTRLTFFFLALSSSHFETAFAHAYVKSWSADGGTVEAAQKRPLEQTAFRGVSQNTGWIGSKFIESAAITCGAHQTPKGMVSAPVEPYSIQPTRVQRNHSLSKLEERLSFSWPVNLEKGKDLLAL